MTKKFLLLFLFLPFILAGCTKAIPESKISELDNKNILFYGETCPHCKILEQFIFENEIDSQMTIERKEVYKEKGNADLMMEAVRRCSLSTNDVGVPFLWTENKCFVGGDEATNFFKGKFKL